MNVTAVVSSLWVKRPFFFVAVAMVVASFDIWWPGFGWFCGFLFGALLWVFVGWRVALLGGGLVLLGVLNVRWHEARYVAGEAWVAKQGLQEVEGRLLEDAKGDDGNWLAIVKLHGTGFRSKKVVWKGSGKVPVAGTEVRAVGLFRPLEPERNPGVVKRRDMLRAEGVIGMFHASEMRRKQWTGPLSKRLAELRKDFRTSIVRGLDEESEAANVIRAVVIGERSPDSLELVGKFRESGTLHVFTVSGLHVAMVGALIWVFLNLLGCPRRWAVPMIIAAMFVYVWLAGSGPAAMRAAWISSGRSAMRMWL